MQPLGVAAPQSSAVRGTSGAIALWCTSSKLPLCTTQSIDKIQSRLKAMLSSFFHPNSVVIKRTTPEFNLPKRIQDEEAKN